jgi:hypothetical protein
MMTLGEAAGQSLYFMANAIEETAPVARFAASFCRTSIRHNEFWAFGTQNVIARGTHFPGDLAAQ